MNKTIVAAVLALFGTMICSSTQAVGFQKIEVADTGSPGLTVGLWYPTEASVPTKTNTEFGMALSIDAPIENANSGLIVISHGYSGWYAGHADTAVALAEAGYIVAAPSHTGNTWSDMSSPVHKWLLDRPRHVSRVIDHLFASEEIAPHLDLSNIGLYGFSAGGYTALNLLGGVPDIAYAQTHCRENPQEYVCSEGLIDAMEDAGMGKLSPSAWGADERIQAAAIAAPGWGFAYPKASLTKITAGVQLWSGMSDTSVPTKTNAAVLATRLPSIPETHWIDNANHFAFLVMPCREEFKQEDPEEYKMVCEDAVGFDRYAFHTNMHKEMVRFFDEQFDLTNQ